MYTKLQKKSHGYFLIIYMKNALQKNKTDKILAAHEHFFVICTHIIRKLHLFSAN